VAKALSFWHEDSEGIGKQEFLDSRKYYMAMESDQKKFTVAFDIILTSKDVL